MNLVQASTKAAAVAAVLLLTSSGGDHGCGRLFDYRVTGNRGVAPDPGAILRICAVGDIFLGRGVTASIKRAGSSYNDVFSDVQPYLQADMCFGNLEGPLTSDPPAPERSLDAVRLYNPLESLDALRVAGFNCLSLANNHILDLGVAGVANTIRWLDQAGIVPAGTGSRPSGRLAVKGTSIVVLAYTCHRPKIHGDPNGLVNEFDLNCALADIRTQAAGADLVVVSLHWGEENSEAVLPVQQFVARKLVDAGADAIFGHGAHRVQGAELYHDRPILYGLGNLIFDQDETYSQEGMIACMDFRGQRCTSLRWIPYNIKAKRRVVLLEGARARALKSKAAGLSEN